MADPFTMFAVASTALNVGGSIASGSAEYQQEMANSQIAGENANRARMSAAQTRLVGQAAEEAKRREVRRSLGRTAAAVSQNGTGGPGYGSNAALLKQSAAEGELDARNVRYDAQSDAYNYELEASNFEAEKRAARRRARGAKWSTAINVASNVVGGVSNYSGLKASRPQPYPKSMGGNSRPTVGQRLVAYGGR